MKVVIVVPTYNERDNIAPLVEALNRAAALVRRDCEILVVDDNSPDGTADVVRALQRTYSNVQLLAGVKQGLGVAYARGLAYALDQMDAGVVVHMDADFSHDPADLPRLIAKIDEGYDLVVGARYISGGALPLVQILVLQNSNARLGERRHELSRKAALRFRQQLFHLAADRDQLRRRAHPVGTGLAGAGIGLSDQSGYPDHEEFVQVRAQDREELDTLQKRVVRVFRLLQDAALEREQCEFPVDVQRRLMEVDGYGRGLGFPSCGNLPGFRLHSCGLRLSCALFHVISLN